MKARRKSFKNPQSTKIFKAKTFSLNFQLFEAEEISICEQAENFLAVEGKKTLKVNKNSISVEFPFWGVGKCLNKYQRTVLRLICFQWRKRKFSRVSFLGLTQSVDS